MKKHENTFAGLSRIQLEKAGKKFRQSWIFRGVDLELLPSSRLVINGPNGSGKSTLLQIISGFVSPTEGKVSYFNGNSLLDADQQYLKQAMAAPYLELIDEFTLYENVAFFQKYKSLKGHLSTDEFIEKTGLGSSSGKAFKYFSSGMKQRVKLGLAILSDTPLLLLDEPLSNLDSKGYDWYAELITGIDPSRMVVVCSNQLKEEAFFCNSNLDIEQFKS